MLQRARQKEFQSRESKRYTGTHEEVDKGRFGKALAAKEGDVSSSFGSKGRAAHL